MPKYPITFIFLTLLVCVLQKIVSSCGTCDPNSCDPPHGCLAGLVKDACDCCYVCARREGDRCDYKDFNIGGFGKCGDNLECLARNDLSWDDPPEAICTCTSQSPLCGSDGVTYENKCQLSEERYRRRDGLRAVSAEPCVDLPSITSAPEDVETSIGSAASMMCEAKAWPLPTILWSKQRNGNFFELPGNIRRVAVQSRNGPGVDETTSWLLFLSISEEDVGTYKCEVENDAGSVSATATLNIS